MPLTQCRNTHHHGPILLFISTILTTLSSAFIIPNTESSFYRLTTERLLSKNEHSLLKRKRACSLLYSSVTALDKQLQDDINITPNKVLLLPLDLVTPTLHEQLKLQQDHEQESHDQDQNKKLRHDTTIAVEGYITHRRSFGSSLAFIDLVQQDTVIDDNNNSNMPSTPPVVLQVLLKNQEYHHHRTRSSFKSILKAFLHPGTKLYLEGKASSTKNPGEVVLLVTYVRILRLSQNSQHVKGILQRIDMDEYRNDGNDGVEKRKEYGTQNGLVFDEIFDSLQLNVLSMDELKEEIKSYLLGLNEFTFLDDSAMGEKKKNKGASNQKNQKKSIPYAKLAHWLINLMPPDNNYPIHILNSKGRTTGSTSRKTSFLPIADNSIMQIPDGLRNVIQNKYNDGSVLGGQKSIKELLSASTTTLNTSKNDNVGLMTITGWVQNRRRFQDLITVVEVVDSFTATGGGNEQDNDDLRMKCILHPSSLLNNQVASHSSDDNEGNTPLQSKVEVYGFLLTPGTNVSLEGYCVALPTFSTDDNDFSRGIDTANTTFWITNVRILKLSWKPSIIRHFLTLLGGTDKDVGRYPFNLDEVAGALDLKGGHKEADALKKICAKEDLTEIQWRAAKLSRSLQDENSRVGRMTDEMVRVLEKYSQMRKDWPLEYDASSESPNQNIDEKKEGDLNPEATLRTMGSLLRKSKEGSRWQRAKQPQLEWMTKQIQDVVKSHPEYGKRPLNILDIGGGRGNLANFMAQKLGQNAVKVFVIDIDGKAVKNGMLQAERKEVDVTYAVGDASCANTLTDLMGDRSLEENQVDVVVALHACGALSDIALGHACLNGAAFVLTPCCFRSNPQLRVTLKDKSSVEPATWLNISQSEHEILKQIAELQGDISTAGDGIHTICAIRAKAAIYHHERKDLAVQLKTFSIGFSTRNYCIIGRFD